LPRCCSGSRRCGAFLEAPPDGEAVERLRAAESVGRALGSEAARLEKAALRPAKRGPKPRQDDAAQRRPSASVDRQHLRSNVISDRDVCAAALLMVKRYGDDAMLEASERADQLLEEGDMAGAETWHRALNERLQVAKPADGEAVH
jgi:hypothetical protein